MFFYKILAYLTIKWKQIKCDHPSQRVEFRAMQNFYDFIHGHITFEEFVKLDSKVKVYCESCDKEFK